MEEKTELEAFIERLQQSQDKRLSAYDKLCELAVSQYDLDKRNRKMDFKDMCQYFYQWWFRNKDKMFYYNSYTRIGELCKNDHATVIHHVRNRKPSANFEENTACIKDFLES
jgi:hypothetical protein